MGLFEIMNSPKSIACKVLVAKNYFTKYPNMPCLIRSLSEWNSWDLPLLDEGWLGESSSKYCTLAAAIFCGENYMFQLLAWFLVSLKIE